MQGLQGNGLVICCCSDPYSHLSSLFDVPELTHIVFSAAIRCVARTTHSYIYGYGRLEGHSTVYAHICTDSCRVSCVCHSDIAIDVAMA